MREKLKRAAGLQLAPDYAMLTVCSSAASEPQTIAWGEDAGEDRYQISLPDGVWDALTRKEAPTDSLETFLESCVDRICAKADRGALHLMVTVPKLTVYAGERIPAVLEKLGLERANIYIQDYLTSFYYYAVNQKKMLWNGDVALIEYQDEQMIGYVMHIDQTKVPKIVTVVEAARQEAGERQRDGRDEEDWKKEKDRLFFAFLGKVFERKNVVTAYIMGDFYDRSWAEKSFMYLCGGRHAFQGKNLYTKGACYAAMDRCDLGHTPDLLFVGRDIVQENLGMQMRVGGKFMYYPLVTAGVNWFEAHHECEFINDGELDLNIISTPMSGGEQVEHKLRLTHLPDRPKRATRLKLVLYFTSTRVCVVEVHDLGFGGLFKSSGKVWKREIHL